MNTKIKKIQRERRRKRIRAKIFGTAETPRLSVFKSNRYLTAQIIDDEGGKTLAAVSTKTIKGANTREKSELAGKSIGEAVMKKGISKIVFDRGGYIYAGSIMALAEGARSAGLKF